MQQNYASSEGVICVKLMMHPNSKLGSIMCNLVIHHFHITINQSIFTHIVNFMALFKFSFYAWLDYIMACCILWFIIFMFTTYIFHKATFVSWKIPSMSPTPHQYLMFFSMSFCVFSKPSPMEKII